MLFGFKAEVGDEVDAKGYCLYEGQVMAKVNTQMKSKVKRAINQDKGICRKHVY